MDRFIMHHRDRILGTLSCFDRVIFKGHLPISNSKGMESFLSRRGVLLKDFKGFVVKVATRLKEQAQAIAARAGRPYRYLNEHLRKEELAREMAREHGVERGLVCVIGVLEPLLSFRMVYGDGRPRLRSDRRTCLTHYFYLIDPGLGFIHVRVPTWFPLTMQVYVNGHGWLAKRMDRLRMKYDALDNAFMSIASPERAQRVANGFGRLPWRGILDRLASRFNPLLKDLLYPMGYYWISEQVEYATDVIFRKHADLQALYPRLLHHAIATFKSENVMRFLGMKLTGHFLGDVKSKYSWRPDGARIRHQVKTNAIKMYNKNGRVLRVETTINRPREFKVRRVSVFRGRRTARWTPMPKGVAFLDRHARIGRAAHGRYLDALAVVSDPAAAREALAHLARPQRIHNRRSRGFNPADPADAALFAAVMRGEHVISGFRNRQIREALFGTTTDPLEARRHAARVTRLFQRLHAHGYIAKIPRTRRWLVTAQGRAALGAVLELGTTLFPAAYKAHAA